MRIAIRPIAASDEQPFVAAARRSRAVHSPWVSAPQDAIAFHRYIARFEDKHNFGFVVVAPGSGQIAGAINLTHVVFGAFRSGYLGYFVFEGYAGQGVMSQGLRSVVRHAFTALGLHRVEANIQPENLASIALVRACGFQKEGLTPSYLKIRGRWRDHERWALVRERKSATPATVPC